MRDHHGRGLMGTPEKEAFVSACLGWHAKYVSSVAPGQTFFHLDLNAGPGFNDLNNGKASERNRDRLRRFGRVIGTPGLIMRKTRDRDCRAMSFDLTFVEKNPAIAASLDAFLTKEFSETASLPGMSVRDLVCRVICGDNETELAAFAARVARACPPELAEGAIISDPNGWARSGGAVELETLARTLRALPRLIVLIRFPAGQAKKNREWKARDPRRNMTIRRVTDYLALPRAHWLISEPHGRDRHNVVLCGSSYRMRAKPEWGIHDVRSERGQAIIKHCDVNRSGGQTDIGFAS